MPSCEMDFRPGGKWRFVNRDDEGNEFVFFGEYTHIEEPSRIDWTFGWEGMDGEPGPETLTLEELDGGRTLLRAEPSIRRARLATRWSRRAWSTVPRRRGTASRSTSRRWPEAPASSPLSCQVARRRSAR